MSDWSEAVAVEFWVATGTVCLWIWMIMLEFSLCGVFMDAWAENAGIHCILTDPRTERDGVYGISVDLWA